MFWTKRCFWGQGEGVIEKGPHSSLIFGESVEWMELTLGSLPWPVVRISTAEVIQLGFKNT